MRMYVVVELNSELKGFVRILGIALFVGLVFSFYC